MSSKIILIVLFVFSMLIMSYRSGNKKKKVLFFGDSITEMGVQSGGYISLINDMAKAEGMDEKYDISGSGIGGNKVYDLYLRLEEDVLAKSPDIVYIFIGTNDVLHKKLLRTGTDIDKFLKFYRAIIKKIEATGAKIVICTPVVIGEKRDGTNEMDNELNGFIYQLIQLSKELQLPLVNLRHKFYEYYLTNNLEDAASGVLTVDGVHLNSKGNQLVAKEIWKSIQEIK